MGNSRYSAGRGFVTPIFRMLFVVERSSLDFGWLMDCDSATFLKPTVRLNLDSNLTEQFHQWSFNNSTFCERSVVLSVLFCLCLCLLSAEVMWQGVLLHKPHMVAVMYRCIHSVCGLNKLPAYCTSILIN